MPIITVLSGLHNGNVVKIRFFGELIYLIFIYGFFFTTIKDELITSCCQNCTEKCDFYNVDNNDVCALHSEDVISQLWMDGLNIYNIYQGMNIENLDDNKI